MDANGSNLSNTYDQKMLHPHTSPCLADILPCTVDTADGSEAALERYLPLLNCHVWTNN